MAGTGAVDGGVGGFYMVLQNMNKSKVAGTCRNTSRRRPDSADTDILNKSEWFSAP